jgi:hypothetical protein
MIFLVETADAREIPAWDEQAWEVPGACELGEIFVSGGGRTGSLVERRARSQEK